MIRDRSIVVRIGLLMGVLAMAGCYQPEPSPKITGEESRAVLPPAQLPPLQQRVLGRSVRGRPIIIQMVGEGSDTTLIMATIHGNEPAGTPLVNKLGEYLRANPQVLAGRRVILMPVANPDGMAAGTRENAHYVDLNRNFVASNRINNAANGPTPLSEPEARAIQAVISDYHPSRIVSIHQPLTCVDYDGPAGALATRVAQYCGLPIKKLGARPGSFGSYAGEELKIPVITIELPESASNLSPAALWDQYGRCLMAAILYPEHPL
jgi:protein MpaA